MDILFITESLTIKEGGYLIMIFNFKETSSTAGAGRSAIPSLVLFVGIIIGVLLLAVFLGVAIVAVLFCIIKRRRIGRDRQEKACYTLGILINNCA